MFALDRVQEVCDAHNDAKVNEWRGQAWRKHFRKAIAHLALALTNEEDGSHIEGAHGATRALMGLELLLEDPNIKKKWCESHAKHPFSCANEYT